MSDWLIPRRTFLRGATGAVLGLPLLDVMQPRVVANATGGSSAPPLRLGCLYLPNGVPNEAWRPLVDGERVIRMNEWMSPFESLKGDLQFLSGLQSETRGSHPGAGATWLVRPCPEGDSISDSGVGQPSMDQIVARVVGADTPLASLELCSRPEGSFSKSLLRSNISWRNGKTPVPREIHPRAIYDRLTGGNAETSEETAQRRAALDVFLEDARGLRRRISNADQYKLDEYLDAVRSVEKRMGRLAEESRARARAKAATFPRPSQEVPEDHAAYLRLMFDMMVLAYWTDSTRVATFMLDQEQTNRYFNFLPEVKGMWHALSHWRDISGKTEDDDGLTSWSSREVKRKQYLSVIKYHHEQVAYFFDRLKSIKEGEGSLLDNCMILYGSPFSDGHEHLSRELPMMIAGRAGGAISPGRWLRNPDGPAEGVYLSMMRLMGVPANQIGGVDRPIAIT